MKRVRYPSRRSRRGAALLIVLGTLILVVTASATLTGIASTINVQRTFYDAALVADDLLLAAEAPIVVWLGTESSQVVLPPEVASPRVNVLHDLWLEGNRTYEIEITAWDQSGMVPLQLARAGSPLRLALPADVRAVVDQMHIQRNQPPGLDLFRMDTVTAQNIIVFPRAAATEPLIFADPLTSSEVDNDSSQQHSFQGQLIPSAIGALVATHSGGGGRINVNTAPSELLEQAFRVAGRGGIESILAARAEGRSVPLGELPAQPGTQRSSPQIVGTSSAWSFRIDIRMGPLKRSWWAVYERSRSDWECVQRLAIPQ